MDMDYCIGCDKYIGDDYAYCSVECYNRELAKNNASAAPDPTRLRIHPSHAHKERRSSTSRIKPHSAPSSGVDIPWSARSRAEASQWRGKDREGIMCWAQAIGADDDEPDSRSSSDNSRRAPPQPTSFKAARSFPLSSRQPAPPALSLASAVSHMSRNYTLDTTDELTSVTTIFTESVQTPHSSSTDVSIHDHFAPRTAPMSTDPMHMSMSRKVGSPRKNATELDRHIREWMTPLPITGRFVEPHIHDPRSAQIAIAIAVAPGDSDDSYRKSSRSYPAPQSKIWAPAGHIPTAPRDAEYDSDCHRHHHQSHKRESRAVDVHAPSRGRRRDRRTSSPSAPHARSYQDQDSD